MCEIALKYIPETSILHWLDLDVAIPIEVSSF